MAPRHKNSRTQKGKRTHLSHVEPSISVLQNDVGDSKNHEANLKAEEGNNQYAKKKRSR